MKWISVKERLPEKRSEVLCFSKGRIFHSWYEGVFPSLDWYDVENCYISEPATHWMPLPEPPKD